MNEPMREPRVLAIDDSILIHRLLKEQLRSENVEIHSASCAAEGLALARSLDPEVILLDVNLPDIDGYEVLSSLKTDAHTREIPVIFLSGSAETTDKVRGLDMGAIDFVIKPFDVTELKARVRAAIRLRTLLRLLAQRAQLDGLTGLWNQTYLDSRLRQELADARRHERPLALLICDVDRFKSINDRWGHPFGDRVLERVAQLLSSGRAGDVPCRYGGEEFALIMPDTKSDGARVVAERLRESLERQKWPNRLDLIVTASFGISDLDRAVSKSSDSLICSADDALYKAKQAGRNRVALAELRPGLTMSA